MLGTLETRNKHVRIPWLTPDLRLRHQHLPQQVPSGLIPRDRALLVAALLYIGLLALACLVPNAGAPHASSPGRLHSCSYVKL